MPEKVPTTPGESLGLDKALLLTQWWVKPLISKDYHLGINVHPTHEFQSCYHHVECLNVFAWQQNLQATQ